MKVEGGHIVGCAPTHMSKDVKGASDLRPLGGSVAHRERWLPPRCLEAKGDSVIKTHAQDLEWQVFLQQTEDNSVIQ